DARRGGHVRSAVHRLRRGRSRVLHDVMATLAVEGYSQLLRATARAHKEQKKATRKILEQAGESVRRDAQSFFSPINSRTAAGFRTRVRVREIVVEQPVKK